MWDQAGGAWAAGEILMSETLRSEVQSVPWKLDKLEWWNNFLCAMFEDSTIYISLRREGEHL